MFNMSWSDLSGFAIGAIVALGVFLWFVFSLTNQRK